MKLPTHVLRRIAIILSIGVIVFSVGWWLYRIHSPCRGQVYTHINPALRCEDKYVLDKSSLDIFEGQLEDFIQSQIDTGNAETVSVYVRDLINGPTLSINSDELFAPASLLKIPVLLTYLRLKEEYGEALLNVELTYTPPAEELSQLIPPQETMQPNTPYTVGELLRYMIAYSDNRAYITLVQYLQDEYPDEDPLRETEADLGIIDPQDFSDQTVSTRSYASIFTQLFHASYFSERASSEWALDLLSQATYDQGLKAGLPSDIEVAHKFGERFGFDEDLVQLHDCGIVYYPENPYLICVMTRGYDLEKLQSVIAAISAKVYVEFDSRKY